MRALNDTTCVENVGLDILDGDAPALIRRGKRYTSVRALTASVACGVIVGACGIAQVFAMQWYLTP